ncbi:MAG: PsbP-related protein [bacterium]|nr:PsbP-related protein [bacterium]
MNQKGFANIILIVVIVVLVGAVGYFAFVKKSEPIAQQATPTPTQTKTPVSPTPTPTSETTNLKTYTDSKYSFEIKYPQNWKLDKYTEGYNNEGPYVLVFTTDRTKVERYPFISVRENWSANKEIDRINNSGSQFTKVKSTKDINIGSILAKQIIYSTDIGLDFEKTIISQNQIVFMFDSYPNDSDLNKVISTFKFTN